MRFKQRMLLWVIDHLFEDKEVRKLADHEKLKTLSRINEDKNFTSYLEFLVQLQMKRIALKAMSQEEIWFGRGRLFQIQILQKSLKDATIKKDKIEKELKTG